jgi:hypothetical protein
MLEFLPSPDAIQVEASINIAASPTHVAAVYADVKRWGETFPATIDHAQVIETGENWQRIEVAHKLEGRVPNTLIFLSDTEIGLLESKRKFDASFLNRFEARDDGSTHFVVTAYISLKGIYRLLKPVLVPYVRRQALKQLQNFVLRPLKQAAEK